MSAPAGIDREKLLSALGERGLEARIVDEAGESVIEIACTEDAAGDVVSEIESLLAELELPLVPEKADGQILIRPSAA